jgi:selenocysteine lyase/cysteine desulfurase
VVLYGKWSAFVRGKIMIHWNAIRKEFPVTENYIYFNHAGVSPLSNRVVEAVEDYLAVISEHGIVREASVRFAKTIADTRAKVARLINAEVDEIAFIKNTTQGILIAANGIDWREGDNVVTANVEFPANVYPWLNLERHGVETRFVQERETRISVKDIERMIDHKTRAVAISFVEFASGFRNDLEAIGQICQEKGIFFIVDAIQGLGALDIDVKKCKIHVMSSDGHKWLMGPEGAGCLYCSKEALDKISPNNIGWNSVINASAYLDYDLVLRPDAQRFEEGSLNVMGIYGLGAAVGLILEIGIQNIETRVLTLTDLLIEKLKEKGYQIVSSLVPGERSGIVCFRSRRHSSAELCRRLMDNGIMVSDRARSVRVSPHFYNSEEEIERMIEVLP